MCKKIISFVPPFLVLLVLFRYGCPFYNLTQIPCPCCGVTRAWIAFLRGDIRLALRYHALFPAVPIVPGVWVIRDVFPACRTKRMDKFLYVFAGILFCYSSLRWLGIVIIP